MGKKFDRSTEDVGNILALEHLNLTVPDQAIAARFYVSGLGLTRDPYMDFGVLNFNNMWVNVGDQQFHLPEGKPQRFRGHIGLTVPDLDQLRWRLERVGKSLEGTQFGWEIYDDHIGVTCPWGNTLRCHAPDASMALGIRYLDMEVPPKTTPGIARFYRDVFATPANDANGIAEVQMGTNQTLRFVETDRTIAAYDGHHIAIYVADFSAAHGWLDERALVTEETDQHQYRFQAIVDPDGSNAPPVERGKAAPVELEHEVRSLRHPMYARHLVNRNSGQTFFTFRRGREAFVP